MKEAKKREEKQKELKEKEKRRKEQKEKERFKIKSHTDSFPHSFYDRFWESPCMVQLQILNHSYRKDFIIDQQGEGEGVLDDLMDALKTGQAYNRDNRRQKPRQTRELFVQYFQNIWQLQYNYMVVLESLDCPLISSHTIVCIFDYFRASITAIPR